MNDTAVISGTIQRSGDRIEARLVRDMAHDPDTVWRMLTQPAALVNWLAPGTLEPRTGGASNIPGAAALIRNAPSAGS